VTRLLQLPQLAVAADVDGTVGDGGGAEDGGGEVEFSDDLAFGFRDVHDANQAALADGVEFTAGGDGAGAGEVESSGSPSYAGILHWKPGANRSK